MRRSVAALLLPFTFALACSGPEPEGSPPAADSLAGRADELAHQLLIVDTHVDVPYRLEREMQPIGERTESGDFDYPRAKEGGLDAPFMSIYVPASYQETGGAKEFAEKMIDMVEGFERQWPEKFAIARSPAEVEMNFAAGLISLPMGMENGAPIEDDLANLAHFYDRGIRYITLTHSQNNQICDTSYADPDERLWNGLSPFGREVVAEMNRLGILIDVSHISDAAFDQVIELTRAPVIASHSSCRHFTPGFERNMSDEMIRKLAANGGTLQINFGSAFLTEEANAWSNQAWAAARAWAAEQGLDEGSDEVREWRRAYREQNPLPLADVGVVADHIDHGVELVGIDHVGIGSDYDGVGPSLPVGLEDVSKFPNLVEELLERGYTEEEIEKILSGNVMRVWREVERVAAELQGG